MGIVNARDSSEIVCYERQRRLPRFKDADYEARSEPA
jgi:hypothetical protein